MEEIGLEIEDLEIVQLLTTWGHVEIIFPPGPPAKEKSKVSKSRTWMVRGRRDPGPFA